MLFEYKHRPEKRTIGVVIFGAKGYIGRKLFEKFQNKSIRLIGTHHKLTNEHSFFDLQKPDISNIDLNGISHGIICCGIPKIGFCEENPEITNQSNVIGTLFLVEKLLEKNITPIVFSTDYVFDGIEGNYSELSPTRPLNEYGRQKEDLEKRIQSSYPDKCILIRLSKVYGISCGDNTLFDEMARKLLTKQDISLAADQKFSPIYIEDVIRSIEYLIENKSRGLFHLCGTESFSRYEMGVMLAHKFGVDAELIKKISLDDLNEKFKRPKNTSMVSIDGSNLLSFKFLTVAQAIDRIYIEYKKVHQFGEI
ncbi:MAG: sugar nucleotide-binding protein [Chlamydiae bacterium]|nr:sugar nucleotide-binding protein [Chlamydiota bacterium]